MWLCLSDSFLSIVAHRDNPQLLLVRARVEGHIEKVFPTSKVHQKAGSDYAFRADIRRAEVVDVIAGRVHQIKYDNFKSSVKDEDLHDAYMGFWQIMFKLQHFTRKVKAISRPVLKLKAKS